MAAFSNIVVLLLAWSLGSSAVAAESKKIDIEFNDLQPADGGGCRAVFVLNNGTDKAIAALSLRVIGFDAKKHASLFLALDVGAVPVGKTRVLRFDLGKGIACTDITRLVLDDVTTCDGPDLNPQKCLGLISLSSRTTAPFDY
jgi:hypothetical protein